MCVNYNYTRRCLRQMLAKIGLFLPLTVGVFANVLVGLWRQSKLPEAMVDEIILFR